MSCYARGHVNGGLLQDDEEEEEEEQEEQEDDEDDEDDEEDEEDEELCCFRCGRPGHFATSCYARSDVDGRRL